MGESREQLWSGKSVAEERESEFLEIERKAESVMKLLKKKNKNRKKERNTVMFSMTMAEKCVCSEKQNPS